MKHKTLLFWTQAAMVAALYVALTFLFAAISFGPVQVRIAEALTILPMFTPAAIPGLFVGCLLGNILGGAVLPDIVFGSLATLIGALGTYALRKKLPLIGCLPPILANTIVVPFVLVYAYGTPTAIPFLMLTIGIGEIVGCGMLGNLLFYVLRKYKEVIFHSALFEKDKSNA